MCHDHTGLFHKAILCHVVVEEWQRPVLAHFMGVQDLGRLVSRPRVLVVWMMGLCGLAMRV
jgi:hypothetical protein